MSDLTLLDHIISQTRQNVELLMIHKRISQSDGRDILAKLPSTVPASIVALTQNTQQLRISPTPTQGATSIGSADSHISSRAEARAIWEWKSEDPNDLSLHVGELIEIVNETNADWWTGRNKAGREGLFPSTYVERLPRQSVSPAFPEFQQSKTSLDLKHGLTEPKYPSPPGPPQYSAPHSAQQQYYPPPPGHPVGGYMPPSGPPYNNNPYSVSPPMAQPIPQQPPKKGRFGGLGATMAQSAAGGLGFGAGAAIGSDVINAIF